MPLVKARDVRMLLKGKVDPDALHVMEALAEQYTLMAQEITAMSQLLDQLITTQSQLADVAMHLRTGIEEFRANRTSDKEDGDDGQQH
jgi:hypothetical protein